MEQRIVIKFHAKLGTSASKTFEMLKKVYGDDCLSKSRIFDWHKQFREGREDAEDAERNPKSKTSRTPEIIQKVRDILAEDKNSTTRMIAEALHMSNSTVHAIITEDLQKKKVCAQFVPHTLRDDEKLKRVNHSRDLIATAENDPNFLKSIVTGDETWCFQYDPETKRQSAEWLSQGDPRPKKVRQEKSRIKTMLMFFYDSKGIVHKEFVPTGQTVNAAFYVEVLKRLLARIARVRPEYRDTGSWSLLHDNAPSHRAILVRDFLGRRNVTMLDHPPYSPDLSPCDFFAFPKLKLTLKGCYFEDIETIQMAATKTLKEVSVKDYAESFQSLIRRCQRCIDAQGDYFE